MSIKQAAILLSLCPVILLTSCRGKPPGLNLENEVIPTSLNGEPYTQEDVQKAILAACNSRGWSAQVDSNGVILASIMVRRHRAKVKIEHTRTTVSISYMDSDELGYSHGKIHPNYNKWVSNLYHSILRSLGSRGQMY